MLGAGQPLSEGHHRLHTRAPGGHGKRHRAVERMGMIWSVEEQPVDPLHRGRNLLDVKHIGDHDLGPQVPQPSAACVVAMDHGSDRDPPFQQLGGDRAADPARGTAYQYAIVCHRISLSF